MKAILEFNLPEDAQDFEQASKANALYVIIFDILNSLRQTTKYDEKSTPEVTTYADNLSGLIHQMLIDSGISIY